MKYYLGKMKLLLVTVFIIFIGLIFTWSKLFGNLQPGQNNNSENQTGGTVTPSQKYKVDLIVDFGNGKVTSYEGVEVKEGDTVYSLLTKKMNETGSPVTAKSYDFGLMVESINNISASATHFWSYSVNEQAGNVAADKYILKNGDKVEWKFTIIQM
jgi:hypothetical protein